MPAPKYRQRNVLIISPLGIQGPSGSSSGAGASIAGYGWLDFALATDSTFRP